jgi:hypothetical protein
MDPFKTEKFLEGLDFTPTKCRDVTVADLIDMRKAK